MKKDILAVVKKAGFWYYISLSAQRAVEVPDPLKEGLKLPFWGAYGLQMQG